MQKSMNELFNSNRLYAKGLKVIGTRNLLERLGYELYKCFKIDVSIPNNNKNTHINTYIHYTWTMYYNKYTI